MVTDDFDGDGNLDIINGNHYGTGSLLVVMMLRNGLFFACTDGKFSNSIHI